MNEPKERVIYDEVWYLGAEGEKMAVNDLMERCFGAAAQERGSGERDHAVEAGAPEPPVPVTELDMEDRGDAR